MDATFFSNIIKAKKEDYKKHSGDTLFHKTLLGNFPGAFPLPDYIDKTYKAINKFGFNDPNTMGMVSICRDEITDPLYGEVVRYWGKTFNCCSLAGFVTMGRTGLAAAMSHTPIENSKRRFVYYAMPHIAISVDGIIGDVMREGIDQHTIACGALALVTKELRSGKIILQTDNDDIEQSIIRQKILSNLKYGEIPSLVEITKLTGRIIQDDLEKLLQTLDPGIYEFGVFTGVEIHGPDETEWIYPFDSYVVQNGNKISLNLD